MFQKEQLSEFGLSPSEIEIYLTLLQYGSLQAGEISKKTRENRTTTYQVLERLIMKGLVSFVQKRKIKVFQATSPQRLLTLQEEKVRLAKELLPNLEKITIPSSEEVTVFKGRQGVRMILSEVLQCKEYVSFGSAGQFWKFMDHDYLLFQKEKKKRNIKSRVVIGKSARNNPYIKRAHARFRYIDDKYMTPTTTWIYKDCIAIVIWSLTPIVTHIRSKDLANAYKSYFNFLWNQAKR